VGRGQVFGRTLATCGLCALLLVGAGRAFGLSSGGQITGFGATVKAWNAHHQMDRRGNLVPGCCYDPIPSQGGPLDRYYTVQPIGGHVISYEMRPGNGKGIAVSAAKQAALQELPPDARIRSFTVHGRSCAILIAYSGALQRQLGHGKAGGGVVVEFSSGAAEMSYSARSVNDLLLTSMMIAGPTAQNC
jgi:hypothetical protein